jgi:D-beta-D-heptose 7-phosphate kinase/D-beta-D-heptose 1-phosphate adenosyltransferase
MDTQLHKKYKILLVGDNGVDQYQYGTVNRISPEAPVPVLDLSHTITKPGMAANVLENLKALGCDVTFEHGLKTCIKTRVIDLRSKQQLIRIDQDQESRSVKINYNSLSKYDAIVVSDYAKGSVDYDCVQNLRLNYTGPIFVDTKKTDLAKFTGCTIKINQLEYSKLVTKPDLLTDMIVTQGDRGAMWNGRLYPAQPVEVSDVCGAGDTFLAALCYGYLETQDMAQAVEFALRASAVTVQHVGVYAPRLEEINQEKS